MEKNFKAVARAQIDNVLALGGLSLMSELEGEAFKDLSKDQQTLIRRSYNIRCAVIPSSWVMSDCIDFFRRIQFGGTPMTEAELRRAITRGPFNYSAVDGSFCYT